MYRETINYFSDLAAKKAAQSASHPFSFIVGAVMAGAYVGLAVLLIVTLGASVPPEMQRLVMGVSFGVALILVVFSGSELFTGHTMYMTFGMLSRKTRAKDVLRVWALSWSFNLVGALVLVTVYVSAKGYLLSGGSEALVALAKYKTNAQAYELFARGILCNWLVCLALWMCARTQSDATKCILIFWCLLAFIASGYEHCVANMTLLSLAYLTDTNATLSLPSIANNLLWVTAGNVVGGSVFMALFYWFASTNENSELKHDMAQSSLITGDKRYEY